MKKIREKLNIALGKIRKSKSGLSFVELVIVIAIAASLVVVTGTALIHMYRARANSASEKISAAISQSKINTLSGKKNKLVIYRDEDGDYYSEFYLLEDYESEDMLDEFSNTLTDVFGNVKKKYYYDRPIYAETPYEQKKICEHNIDVFFHNLANDPFQLEKSEKAGSELIVKNKIEIEFSSQDGSVVSARRLTSTDGATFTSNSIITQGVSEEFNKQIRISVEAGAAYNITVYCLTGGIETNGR